MSDLIIQKNLVTDDVNKSDRCNLRVLAFQKLTLYNIEDVTNESEVSEAVKKAIDHVLKLSMQVKAGLYVRGAAYV